MHFQKASRFQTRLNYVLFIGILFYSVSLWIKCKCNIKWGGAREWEHSVSFHQHHAAAIHKPVRFSRLHWLWTLHVACLIALSFLTTALKCIADLYFITIGFRMNFCHSEANSSLLLEHKPVFMSKCAPRAPPLGAVDFLQHCLISGSNWKCTLKVNG